MQALTSLNVKQDDTLFLNRHILERLDSVSKIEILKKLPRDKSVSTNELIELIKNRIRFLENMNIHKTKNSHRPNNNSKLQSKTNIYCLSSTMTVCSYCHDLGHKLKNCFKFSANEVSPSTRFDYVKQNGLCTNCLSDGHRVINCTSSNCKICNLKQKTWKGAAQENNSEHHKQSLMPEVLSNASVAFVSSVDGDNQSERLNFVYQMYYQQHTISLNFQIRY